MARGAVARFAIRLLQNVDAATLVALRFLCLHPLAAETSDRSRRSERPNTERYRCGSNTCRGCLIHLSRTLTQPQPPKRASHQAALELLRSCFEAASKLQLAANGNDHQMIFPPLAPLTACTCTPRCGVCVCTRVTRVARARGGCPVNTCNCNTLHSP